MKRCLIALQVACALAAFSAGISMPCVSHAANGPGARAHARPQISGIDLFPSRIGIPAAPHDRLVAYFENQAEWILRLTADLYGDQQVWRRHPDLLARIAATRGFWPELQGRVVDPHYARPFSAEYRLRATGAFEALVRTHGPHAEGGLDLLPAVEHLWSQRPELGDMPWNGDLAQRVVSQLRTLGETVARGREEPVVVILDPHPAEPETLERARKAGAIWIDASTDAGLLSVDPTDGLLWVRDPADPSHPRRVHVLLTRFEAEAADPGYLPQGARNRESGRGDLQDLAARIGVRGLVDAWLRGNFIWAGGSPVASLSADAPALKIMQELAQRERKASAALVGTEQSSLGSPNGVRVQPWGLVDLRDGRFEATLSRNMIARLRSVRGERVTIAQPAYQERVGALKPLPRIGAPQIGIPFQLLRSDEERIATDSESQAIMEAAIIRDLYDDADAFFARFPRARAVIEASPFYRPRYWDKGNPHRPRHAIFYSAADYALSDSLGWRKLENNTTNIGGLFRQYVEGDPIAIREMKELFDKVASLDPAGAKDHRPVYVLEETDLGTPWAEVRKRFQDDFGFPIVSAAEIAKGRLFAKGGKLVYVGEDGKEQVKTLAYLHIEPDLIDPDLMTEEELARVPAEELELKRKHLIPGLFKTNAAFVNPPGIDISCVKTLFALDEVWNHYARTLKLKREIPAVPGWSFVGLDGKLDPERYEEVRREPTKFVLKYGPAIGSGDGFFPLGRLSAAERGQLLRRVLEHPADWKGERLIEDFTTDPFGTHTEVRFTTAVAVDMQSSARPVVLKRISRPYGRGAVGNRPVNLMGTGSNGGAGGGYRVHVQVVEATDPLARARDCRSPFGNQSLRIPGPLPVMGATPREGDQSIINELVRKGIDESIINELRVRDVDLSIINELLANGLDQSIINEMVRKGITDSIINELRLRGATDHLIRDFRQQFAPGAPGVTGPAREGAAPPAGKDSIINEEAPKGSIINELGQSAAPVDPAGAALAQAPVADHAAPGADAPAGN